MAWDNDEIREDIYKDLYFNTDVYNKPGLLNLINLADREEEQRQAIAKKGNTASLKTRRINKGVKATLRFAYFQRDYFNDATVIKDQGGRKLTVKEENHINALNNKYDRLELEYKTIRQKLKELYNVDVLEITKERTEQPITALYWAHKSKAI